MQDISEGYMAHMLRTMDLESLEGWEMIPSIVKVFVLQA